MTRAITVSKEPEQLLRELMAQLMAEELISGVITLLRSDDGVAYSIVSDPAQVERAVPLHPLMPTNLGQVLGRLTKRGGFREPVMVVARPCELRGFVELVKREQGSADNILWVSYVCGGVFPLEESLDGGLGHLLEEYWDAVEGVEVHPRLRPACRSCTEFVPYTADITLLPVGAERGATILALTSPKGEELGASIGIEGGEEVDQGAVSLLRKRREEERERIFERDAPARGLEGLVDVFGRCIGCHACSKACPICYCTLCAFESSHSETLPHDISAELERKPGMRVPPGTVYFHLGRMTHIGISCVACGSCQDVCPVDIPISILFKRVSESVQDAFHYVPGRDPSEQLPVCTFEVDELTEVED